MTDYTPSTEAVGYAYIMHKESKSFSTRDNTPDYEDEFYRWFDEVKAQVWDRGYEAGLTDFASSMTTNPYRQGEAE